MNKEFNKIYLDAYFLLVLMKVATEILRFAEWNMEKFVSSMFNETVVLDFFWLSEDQYILFSGQELDLRTYKMFYHHPQIDGRTIFRHIRKIADVK